MIGPLKSIVAIATLLLPAVLNAQNQITEIANLQITNSVSATV